MFALHETTQRRVCRIAFLVLCVVPTLLTLAAVAYCNRPWRHRDWQDSLASHLHVRAQLADITRPQPGETVLIDLRLADLESEEFFCSTERVQSRTSEGRLVIDVERLQIPASRLNEFWDAFSTWLATDTRTAVDINLSQLTIAHDTFPDWQLKNVKVRSDREADGSQRVVLVGQDSANLKFKSGLIVGAGTWDAKIEASLVPLPAWLVEQFVPGTGSCVTASFCGIIAIEQTRGQYAGRLQGKFAAVDLQQWIGMDGPHRLKGSATLDFTALDWSDGRITSASGSLRSDTGVMSYSLFDSAQKLCGVVPGPAWDVPVPSPPDTMIEFDEAAIQFQLRPDGIRFAGLSVDGAIAAKNQTPLVNLQQSEIALPVGQIVRLLNYLEQLGWLPATRKAHDMASRLPLPGDEGRSPAGDR